MKHFTVILFLIISIFNITYEEHCGCKYTRLCYIKMIDDLLVDDEDACVENVEVGSSTVTIFLQALQKYCRRVMHFNANSSTFEGRNLYEVIINSSPETENNTNKKPVVVIDAGQDAGLGPVSLALYIIEQLVACLENKVMIQKIQWVILPSTNPDGLEIIKSEGGSWHKNYRPIRNQSNGVDISKNFDVSWDLCLANDNIFSLNYPGPKPASEIETVFVTEVLKKYKNNIKAYISLRRDGHAILYPYASKDAKLPQDEVKKRANAIAGKVNQRTGTVQWFVNESIYNMNGKARCGHSVDYAFNNLNIPYAYEMRVFSELTKDIMSMFQPLPKGLEASLRAGYFSGIRELYNSIINENKQKPKK